MSKIGKSPIPVIDKTQVIIDQKLVTVTGPKGTLSVTLRPEIKAGIENGQVIVTRNNDSIMSKSLHGLSRSLIANMIQGVNQGFEKKLKVIGTGFRAKIEGKDLILTVGFSHPVKVTPPEGIEFTVKDSSLITVAGIDKQLVGQVAAKLRDIKKPDPYKGKGIRYEKEIVRKKAGKAAKTAAA